MSQSNTPKAKKKIILLTTPQLIECNKKLRILETLDIKRKKYLKEILEENNNLLQENENLLQENDKLRDTIELSKIDNRKKLKTEYQRYLYKYGESPVRHGKGKTRTKRKLKRKKSRKKLKRKKTRKKLKTMRKRTNRRTRRRR